MCAYPSVVARATVADSDHYLYCTVSERPSVSNDRPSSTDVSQMLMHRHMSVGFQRAMSPAGAQLRTTDAIEIRSQCDRASVLVIDVALQVGHSCVGHRQRSCDDHEICARSRSRMMLELMREREVTARPIRIGHRTRPGSAAAQLRRAARLDCAVFRSQHSKSKPAIQRWRTAFGRSDKIGRPL